MRAEIKAMIYAGVLILIAIILALVLRSTVHAVDNTAYVTTYIVHVEATWNELTFQQLQRTIERVEQKYGSACEFTITIHRNEIGDIIEIPENTPNYMDEESGNIE